MAADEAFSEFCAPSRHEKSLGLLTTKFVTLLQEAKDGVLDLKVAADTLAVRQKRRIYDITNVLEGIGLIEKKSKNSIQWKGAGPACNTQEVSDRLEELKEEIAELEENERRLDTHRSWISQSLTNIADDAGNAQLAYLNHEDVCSCFPDDTLLVVQAPPGTQLDVPVPDVSSALQRRFQICLKSRTSPIYVILVNKETKDSKPTVVEVPPRSVEDSSAAPIDVDLSEKVQSPLKMEVVETTPPVATPTQPSVTATEPAPAAAVVTPVPVDACPATTGPPKKQPEDMEQEGGEDDKTKQKKDKKEVPKPTPPSPSKITTRAGAIRIQQEMQEMRRQEVRTTRQGTKFTMRPLPLPATEPMDVSLAMSPPTRKRQSPRKGSTPNVKTTATPTTTTTVAATTITTKPAVIEEVKTPEPIVRAVSPVAGQKKFLSDSSSTTDYIDDFLSSEIFSPLLRLSPPPSDRDYYFNLEDNEGLCDLFDVPMLRM